MSKIHFKFSVTDNEFFFLGKVAAGQCLWLCSSWIAVSLFIRVAATLKLLEAEVITNFSMGTFSGRGHGSWHKDFWQAVKLRQSRSISNQKELYCVSSTELLALNVFP